MKRLILVGLITLLVASGVASAADGNGKIEITSTTECTATNIDCPFLHEGHCTNGKTVEWKVTNYVDKNVDVIVHKLKHNPTGLYIDPLVSQGNNKSVHTVKVAANGENELKTKVRKVESGWEGPYKYTVAIKFDDLDPLKWKDCEDPMIDIGN